MTKITSLYNVVRELVLLTVKNKGVLEIKCQSSLHCINMYNVPRVAVSIVDEINAVKININDASFSIDYFISYRVGNTAKQVLRVSNGYNADEIIAMTVLYPTAVTVPSSGTEVS